MQGFESLGGLPAEIEMMMITLMRMTITSKIVLRHMIVMITLMMMMTTKSNIVCASDQGAILRKGQLMALCPFTLIIREVIIIT